MNGAGCLDRTDDLPLTRRFILEIGRYREKRDETIRLGGNPYPSPASMFHGASPHAILLRAKRYPEGAWGSTGVIVARLTDRSIEALRPRAVRYEVWDEGRKGFGLRVTPRGAKSFVWVYHFDGRPRRLTFGTYPHLSLADAGVKLAEAKSLLGKGIDPGLLAVAERDTERHAETVNELVAAYLDR